MLTKTKLKEMIYKDRFEDIYQRFSRNEINCEQAAELLHCSIRTFQRKRAKYLQHGLTAILDKRIGNTPHNKIPADKVQTILSLAQQYPDYNIRHLHHEIITNYNINQSYSSFRRILMAKMAYNIGRKPKKKKHRLKRARAPRVGIMIHQDGSTHNWLYGTDNMHDLIITMDDATNEIYSAFLCEEEGTFSSFRGIKETIDKKGLFHSFYVDRGSHYAFTKKAGDKVDKSVKTQIQRALEQLGITMINAYSPQARGRSERMFGTWQGRLPQELKKHKISSLKEANEYISNIFLPKMNQEFIKEAQISGSDFVSSNGVRVRETLCIQEERTVNNDNTVSYNNQLLQIPSRREYRYLAKSRVKVHDYGDGRLEIYHGLKLLGRYNNGLRKQALQLIECGDYSNKSNYILEEQNDLGLRKKVA